MEIKVLGTGCKKCNKLEKNALKAVESKENISVIKVSDLQEIMSYGVMQTPALVIDDKVVSVGKVLTEDEIKKMIK